MIKTIPIVFLVYLVMVSCKPVKPEFNRITLTHKYYEALNKSDFPKVRPLFFDSVRVRDGDYSISYSIQDYKNWFQWDSVLRPSYEILEIKENKESVDSESRRLTTGNTTKVLRKHA